MKIILEDELLEKVDTITNKMQKKMTDPYLQAKLAELNRSYRSLLRLQREALTEVFQELCAQKPTTLDYKSYQIRSITIQKGHWVIDSDRGEISIDKNAGEINAELDKVVQSIIGFCNMEDAEKDQFFSQLYMTLKHKPALLEEALAFAKTNHKTEIVANKKAWQEEWDFLHQKNYYVSKGKREILQRLTEYFKTV